MCSSLVSVTQPFEAAICEVSVCSESAVLDERSANQKLESSLVNFRMAHSGGARNAREEQGTNVQARSYIPLVQGKDSERYSK